jgi:hypothetical protein
MKKRSLRVACAAVLLWLSVPAVVVADDCRNLGADERDGTKCPIHMQVFGNLMGVAIAAGFASWKLSPGQKPKPAPPKLPPTTIGGQAFRPTPPPTLQGFGKKPGGPPPSKDGPDNKPWWNPGRYL